MCLRNLILFAPTAAWMTFSLCEKENPLSLLCVSLGVLTRMGMRRCGRLPLRGVLQHIFQKDGMARRLITLISVLRFHQHAHLLTNRPLNSRLQIYHLRYVTLRHFLPIHHDRVSYLDLDRSHFLKPPSTTSHGKTESRSQAS